MELSSGRTLTENDLKIRRLFCYRGLLGRVYPMNGLAIWCCHKFNESQRGDQSCGI